MKIEPKYNISSERAYDMLFEGLPLIDFYISGEIKIESIESWDKEVIIENCVVEYFSGSATKFKMPIKFTNSVFKDCQFVFGYFLGGLIIDNCKFENYLDFQAGGHNKNKNEIIIVKSDFLNFVNFFDCWYENEVTISDNNFLCGTNLLGKPHNISVTFDIEPIINNNFGQLNLNNEGEEFKIKNF